MFCSLNLSFKPDFHLWLKQKRKYSNSYFTAKTALTQTEHKHKHKHKDKFFSFFLCLRLCLDLPEQVKMKYRSPSNNTLKHKDIYHTWLSVTGENTGSRSPRTLTVRNVQMILLELVFASNFVFTWVISRERMHMTSWQPYWCSKTIKQRPCCCTKPITW